MYQDGVAPFTGAWIEIDLRNVFDKEVEVAPFTGAWIEILMERYNVHRFLSLPSRERGLKS